MKFHPLADIFPLIEGDEFKALVGDIAEHGLRQAIISYEGQILDGRNRWRACQEIGLTARVEPYLGDDPLAFVVSLNLTRRHLNESQRSMVAAKVANMPRGRQVNAPIGAFGQPEAAEMLNVSRRGVQRAEVVQDKGSEGLQAAVMAGNVAVSTAADVASLPIDEQEYVVAKGESEILKAAKEIRAKRAEVSRADRIGRIAEISKGNADLSTDRKYPVIYADPPWQYENPPMGASNRAIENHYPTMTLEQICALPVSDLATDDAVLYLWATTPKLAECMDVIEAWGFNYRTSMVWVKDKIGMGYHVRNQHEILLIAKRGEIPPPPISARVSSVVTAPRTEHSAKPEEFYSIIEAMYPELPKIELFCRSPRDGWNVWGNQSEAAE